jgi:hypothetical protein
MAIGRLTSSHPANHGKSKMIMKNCFMFLFIRFLEKTLQKDKTAGQPNLEIILSKPLMNYHYLSRIAASLI